MTELLIMRHAKSDWSTGNADFHRPLNDRGVRAAEQMAQWIADHDVVPERVVSSPAQRTRSTAMQVVYTCGIDRSKIDFYDELYLADAGDWLEMIRRQSCSRLLVVGHNPGLDDLVDHLSSRRPPLSASGKLMTTAAIAHLSFTTAWSDIGAGSGTLLSITRPREL